MEKIFDLTTPEGKEAFNQYRFDFERRMVENELRETRKVIQQSLKRKMPGVYSIVFKNAG